MFDNQSSIVMVYLLHFNIPCWFSKEPAIQIVQLDLARIKIFKTVKRPHFINIISESFRAFGNFIIGKFQYKCGGKSKHMSEESSFKWDYRGPTSM